MDRLANKLGGAALLPPTFNWLPRMMTSSAWRDRHAALMAISAISEGCRELMIGELDKVLDLVLPALRDPHPRVRWAGCNALGQMSTDFAGPMQEKYNQIVLPAIIPVLESPEPRVQAHAAAALVNFCEEAEKSVLEPYLDNLLQHLLVLLQSPKRFVQEQALSTIATVADSAESAFGRYYDTLMPLLFNVLKEEQSKEYRLLRAKAMECATLIGKFKFFLTYRPYANSSSPRRWQRAYGRRCAHPCTFARNHTTNRHRSRRPANFIPPPLLGPHVQSLGSGFHAIPC